jgi:hypothetical protein
MSPLQILTQLTEALVHDNVAVIQHTLHHVHDISLRASSEMLYLLHQLCKYYHVRRHTECVNVIANWLYDSGLYVDVVFAKDIQAGTFLSLFYTDVDKFLTFIADYYLISYEPRTSGALAKHLQTFQQGKYASLII